MVRLVDGDLDVLDGPAAIWRLVMDIVILAELHQLITAVLTAGSVDDDAAIAAQPMQQVQAVSLQVCHADYSKKEPRPSIC